MNEISDLQENTKASIAKPCRRNNIRKKQESGLQAYVDPIKWNILANRLLIPHEKLGKGISKLNTDWWLDFMTEDAELRYANNPEVRGEDARKMFDGVFQALDLIEHHIQYFDYVPPRIYQAVRVQYRVKGYPADQDIDIPGLVTFFVKEDAGGKLKCYRAETFLDPSPVFARIAESQAKQS